MHLQLSKVPLSLQQRAVVHSIEGLTLHIVDESLLYDCEMLYVFAYDDHGSLVGEMSVTLGDIGQIDNVWIHPAFRNNVLLFKMAQMLKSTVDIKHFEAHVRDYTPITPDHYSGRLGLPKMLRSHEFYEYFLAPSLGYKKVESLALPSNDRSIHVHQFENGMIVEDYAHIYCSTNNTGQQVSIGHIKDFIEPDEYLHAITQHYAYLNLRTLKPLEPEFNVVKHYKTTVFKTNI